MASSMASGSADQSRAGRPSWSSRLSCVSTKSSGASTSDTAMRAAKRMPSATAAPCENAPYPASDSTACPNVWP